MKKQVLDIFRNSLLIAAVASVSATHSVAQTSSDYNKREPAVASTGPKSRQRLCAGILQHPLQGQDRSEGRAVTHRLV